MPKTKKSTPTKATPYDVTLAAMEDTARTMRYAGLNALVDEKFPRPQPEPGTVVIRVDRSGQRRLGDGPIRVLVLIPGDGPIAKLCADLALATIKTRKFLWTRIRLIEDAPDFGPKRGVPSYYITLYPKVD